jgi:hypothetical protein
MAYLASGRHGLGVGDKHGVAAAVVRQWVFLPLCAFGTSDLWIGRSSLMHLGSQVSYRHDGRGLLTTNLVKTPSIEALTGDVMRTLSQIDSRYWDQPNILPIDLNRPRLILKLKNL